MYESVFSFGKKLNIKYYLLVYSNFKEIESHYDESLIKKVTQFFLI